MEFSTLVKDLRGEGSKAEFPSHAIDQEYARLLDAQDPLRTFREKFIIPSKADIEGSHVLFKPEAGQAQCPGQSKPSLYFCGNSLGLQPRAVSEYLQLQLATWRTFGVHGHFRNAEDTPLPKWADFDEFSAQQSACLVGADPKEIVVMGTLTSNLHMMMASFYTPTEPRHKIICEWRPFPSDYYAIESQIRWHGLEPSTSMVLVEPDDPETCYISTETILRIIEENAAETALLLLPGIQYYSGQLFDIPTITKFAQSHGITVGWDLAHAAGNVELRLHDWNVDFAVWCTYKYINAGPGSIAGAFVHERHGHVEYDAAAPDTPKFRNRLSGWYGGDKSVRFQMDNKFKPIPGAGGFQMSNPSAIDMSSLCASLSIFNETTMATIRDKSLVITAYLEYLLNQLAGREVQNGRRIRLADAFRILTPPDPMQRGAQLSVLLRPGLLGSVSQSLHEAGIVADKREPGVIRVAPAPLYNTFSEVWDFVKVLENALVKAALTN